MKSFVGYAAILFAIASAPLANADANTTKAKQLYEDGVTNYNLSHFEEALTAFEMAYRIRHDPAFLFNIAQCQRNLKRYEEAQRTYRAYLRETADLPPATRAQIQQIMDEMERALAEERAKKPPTGTQPPATSQPPPETTTNNGQPEKTSPPTATVATTREANTAELHAARTKRIAGLVVGGLGIVGLGVGGACVGLANDANRHIVSGDTWTASSEDRRNTYQTLDVAFFVIGGVALTTGIVLYLVGRHDERRRYRVERALLAPGPIANFVSVSGLGGF